MVIEPRNKMRNRCQMKLMIATTMATALALTSLLAANDDLAEQLDGTTATS